MASGVEQLVGAMMDSLITGDRSRVNTAYDGFSRKVSPDGSDVTFTATGGTRPYPLGDETTRRLHEAIETEGLSVETTTGTPNAVTPTIYNTYTAEVSLSSPDTSEVVVFHVIHGSGRDAKNGVFDGMQVYGVSLRRSAEN